MLQGWKTVEYFFHTGSTCVPAVASGDAFLSSDPKGWLFWKTFVCNAGTRAPRAPDDPVQYDAPNDGFEALAS